MRVRTETITFDGGGAKALSMLSAVTKACQIYVQPGKANTHEAYVGDALLVIATSTTDHVVHQLAKPSAADAVLDKWELETRDGANRINLAEFKFDGTSGEKVRVTVYEG